MVDLIKVKGLSYAFGNIKVLDDVNINIEKGKIYSILGPNGSGKTTLLKSIAKIIDFDKERVFLEGKDINLLNRKEIAKVLAYVPQSTVIDFDFTCIDIVKMGRISHMRMFQSESEEDYLKTKKAMQLTNTWHLCDKNIGKLSGGERQRVIIARALAQDTEIMLLDEPVSSLDIHHQHELMRTLRKLNKDNKITIICVLHDLNLALLYSDEAILMKDGKVIDIGEVNSVITNENVKEIYGIDVQRLKSTIDGQNYIVPIVSQNA